MITKIFFGLAKDLIFTPSKTFHKVKEIRNTTPYLAYLVVYYLIYGLLYYLFIPSVGTQQVITEPTPTVLAMGQFLDSFTAFTRTYPVLIGVLGWLFFSGTHSLFARLFSKSGKFISLLIAEGIISVVIGPVDLLLRITHYQLGIPSLSLLASLSGLLGFYLSMVAISVIFEISKIRAFLIQIISFMLFIALFMVYMSLSVANILSSP